MRKTKNVVYITDLDSTGSLMLLLDLILNPAIEHLVVVLQYPMSFQKALCVINVFDGLSSQLSTFTVMIGDNSPLLAESTWLMDSYDNEWGRTFVERDRFVYDAFQAKRQVRTFSYKTILSLGECTVIQDGPYTTLTRALMEGGAGVVHSIDSLIVMVPELTYDTDEKLFRPEKNAQYYMCDIDPNATNHFFRMIAPINTCFISARAGKPLLFSPQEIDEVWNEMAYWTRYLATTNLQTKTLFRPEDLFIETGLTGIDELKSVGRVNSINPYQILASFYMMKHPNLQTQRYGINIVTIGYKQSQGVYHPQALMRETVVTDFINTIQAWRPKQ